MQLLSDNYCCTCREVLPGLELTGLAPASELKLPAMDWWLSLSYFLCTSMLSLLLTIAFPLQVFFAQLMLADMNKELKGLRFYIHLLNCANICYLILYLYELLYCISQHFASPPHECPCYPRYLYEEMELVYTCTSLKFFFPHGK